MITLIIVFINVMIVLISLFSILATCLSKLSMKTWPSHNRTSIIMSFSLNGHDPRYFQEAKDVIYILQ